MTLEGTILIAYIINLDSATERWDFVRRNFDETRIPYVRVSGVYGRALTLPHPQYDSLGFTLRHGHKTNHGAIGCYLSHLRCIDLFLESGDSHAIIAEDDSTPIPELASLIDRAREYQETWDILRLCGFHDPHAKAYASLGGKYQLGVCMTRLCGTGCYVLTRHAALQLRRGIDPMRLPIDHAIDREWAFGLRAAAVLPLPVQQRAHQFITQCGEKPDHKHPWYLRYWSVFPYRAWNETCRVLYRQKQFRDARRAVNRLSQASAIGIATNS